MAISIGTNFDYNGKLFDFQRQSFTTLALMKAAPETNYPDGYEVYCAETEKWYMLLSGNSEDPTTGKWRERKGTTETPTIDLINNLTTQTSGQGALDAAQGYALKQLIDTTNSSISTLQSDVTELQESQGTQEGTITELKSKVDKFIATKGQANGLATLDASGKIPAAQMANGWNDVIDIIDVVTENPSSGMTIGDKYYNSTTKRIFTANSATTGTESDPEDDALYVNIATNKTLRWTGTNMAEVGGGVALGETPQTAYAGDKGKANRDALNSAPNIISSISAPTLAADKMTLNFSSATKGENNIYESPEAATMEIPAVDGDNAGLMLPAQSAQLERLMDETFPFSIATLTCAQGTLFEAGTKQKLTFNWTYNNADINPVKSQTFDSNSVNAGTLTYTVEEANATKSYQLKVTTTTGKEANRSVTVTFANASYYGAVANNFVPSTENVQTLTKVLRGVKGYTINSINLNNQKICYAYPKSFGALTSIKDANGYDYLDSYTQTEITIDTVAYYCYTLTNATTINGFKQAFS